MSRYTIADHTVTGDKLALALNAVADDWAQLGRDIHAEDAYASHVDQATKDANLADMLAASDRIRAGHISSFTIAQRLNTKLTGMCVPLFSS
jgi:hypothetical protein